MVTDTQVAPAGERRIRNDDVAVIIALLTALVLVGIIGLCVIVGAPH
jgi:hypothetical protein